VEIRNKLAQTMAEAGFTLFRVNGKKGTRGWNKAKYRSSDEMLEYLKPWGGNYGVKIEPGFMVIDIDPRRFPEGRRPDKELMEAIGVSLRGRCATVLTGGGGIHIYLRIPEDVDIQEEHEQWPGIEFKTAGRFVVGPGCIHPETKRRYRLDMPFSNMKDAPPELIKLIVKKNPKDFLKGVKGTDEILDEDLTVVRDCIQALEQVAPAIEGESGDKATFVAACIGRDHGLSIEMTAKLMLEHFNPRCEPPWDERELEKKVKNAFAYAKGIKGNKAVAQDFDVVPEVEIAEEKGRRWDWRLVQGKKTRTVTINNVVNYLETEEALINCIKYNEFDNTIRLFGRPPWDESNERLNPLGESWSDETTIKLKHWLSSTKAFEVNVSLLLESVIKVADDNKFHPLREYLLEIEWDGIPRVDKWLHTYGGANDNLYTRAIARVALLRAVARIFDPGCKADEMLILEGKQGIGKSTMIVILGGIWAADFVIDPHNKDTVGAMQGIWFGEMSEMEVFKKAEAVSLRSFVSRTTDRVRPPYGKFMKDYPRQITFIGTINPDATNRYLTDVENRRFHPVHLIQVDFEALKADRDQLFAEAVHRYHLNEKTYITDHKELKAVKREQLKRRSMDPWVETIQNWIAVDDKTFTTTNQVWEHALTGDPQKMTHQHQRRIAQVLKDLGYESGKQRIKGKVISGWVNKDLKESLKDE